MCKKQTILLIISLLKYYSKNYCLDWRMNHRKVRKRQNKKQKLYFEARLSDMVEGKPLNKTKSGL